MEIEKVMLILESHYKLKQRTTLNRMRLNQESPFKILIACLLSLRSRDEITEEITKNLFEIADTPKKILEIPTEKLEKIIYKTGHYKKKSLILKSVSKELIDRFNSEVPDTREELISIKYIGIKTANIVLSFAFNKEFIPVDTNVHRITNRLGWVNTKIPDNTEIELTKILPKKFWPEINALFMLHGKNICVPLSPFCSKCPVYNYCQRKGVTSDR